MLNTVTERYEAFFKQKNVVTDFLVVLEEKTGVQKQYIATGTWLVLIFGLEAAWMIYSGIVYLLGLCELLRVESVFLCKLIVYSLKNIFLRKVCVY